MQNTYLVLKLWEDWHMIIDCLLQVSNNFSMSNGIVASPSNFSSKKDINLKKPAEELFPFSIKELMKIRI